MKTNVNSPKITRKKDCPECGGRAPRLQKGPYFVAMCDCEVDQWFLAFGRKIDHLLANLSKKWLSDKNSPEES